MCVNVHVIIYILIFTLYFSSRNIWTHYISAECTRSHFRSHKNYKYGVRIQRVVRGSSIGM